MTITLLPSLSYSDATIEQPDCSQPDYDPAQSYSRGARVYRNGREFQCLEASWCTPGFAQWYAPGTGSDWQSAWFDLGMCGGEPVVSQVPQIRLVATQVPVVDGVAQLPVLPSMPLVKPATNNMPIARDTNFESVPAQAMGADLAVFRDPRVTGRAADLCELQNINIASALTWQEFRAQQPSGAVPPGTLIIEDNIVWRAKSNGQMPPSQGLGSYYDRVCRVENSMRLNVIARLPNAVQQDWDSNDPWQVRQPNDSFAQAQPIEPIGSLNGHLGNSSWGQDQQDVFVADFYAGQLLHLDWPSDVALQAKLFNEQFELVDWHLQGSGPAALTVPQKGRYYVALSLEQGSTSYILNILEADPARVTPLKDFVLGEAIVEWQQPQLAPYNALRAESLHGFPQRVTMALPSLPKVDALVLQQAERTPLLAELASLNAESYRRLAALYDILALEQLPMVAAAQPNYRIVTQNAATQEQAIALLNANFPRWEDASNYVDDEHANLLWAFPRMNVPLAWNYTQGEGAIIAVLDAHMVPHVDLDGMLVDGYNMAGPNGPTPDFWYGGSGLFNNHGLHIAGTIAARRDQVGIVGIAPKARIMPVQIANSGGATAFDMAQGVLYAAGLENDAGVLPNRPADVINISFGTFFQLPVVERAVDLATAQGIIVVGSSGNDNNDNSLRRHFPSSYDSVLGVANLHPNGSKATSSNYGDNVDLAAPGTNIYSLAWHFTQRTSTWEYKSGTSMAAPHVAAVAAMMKVIDPSIDLTAFRAMLAAGELTQPGSQGWEPELGWGVIDAHQAVQAAYSGVGARVYAAPNRIFMRPGLDNADFSLHGLQTEFTLLEVTAAHPALSIEDLGADRFRLWVDPELVSEAVLQSQIRVRTLEHADLLIPVQFLQLNAANVQGSSGALTLKLHDVYGGLVAVVPMQDLGDGRFEANQSGLPIGYYVLTVSSDINGDGQPCGFAELCGQPRMNNRPRWFDMTSRADYRLELPLRMQNSKHWR